MEDSPRGDPASPGLNDDPNAAQAQPGVATPASGPAGLLSAAVSRLPKLESVPLAASARIADVARLRGDLGTLQRLQLQLQQARAENERLRRLLQRGLAAVQREHAERSLEYDNIAKEKQELTDKLREALSEVDFHQGDVHLAFSESRRVGTQNLHLLRVLDEKEAALEELRGRLAMSDYSHRRTVDLLEQSETARVELGEQHVKAVQEGTALREKLARSHSRAWRLEGDNEGLRDEVTRLRRQVVELQGQLVEWGVPVGAAHQSDAAAPQRQQPPPPPAPEVPQMEVGHGMPPLPGRRSSDASSAGVEKQHALTPQPELTGSGRPPLWLPQKHPDGHCGHAKCSTTSSLSQKGVAAMPRALRGPLLEGRPAVQLPAGGARSLPTRVRAPGPWSGSGLHARTPSPLPSVL